MIDPLVFHFFIKEATGMNMQAANAAKMLAQKKLPSMGMGSAGAASHTPNVKGLESIRGPSQNMINVPSPSTRSTPGAQTAGNMRNSMGLGR